MLVACGSGTRITSRPLPSRHLLTVSDPSEARLTSTGLATAAAPGRSFRSMAAKTPPPPRCEAAHDMPTRETARRGPWRMPRCNTPAGGRSEPGGDLQRAGTLGRGVAPGGCRTPLAGDARLTRGRGEIALRV